MPLVEILRHLPADDVAMGHEEIGVPGPLLGRHLEGDMEKLADMRIEIPLCFL